MRQQELKRYWSVGDTAYVCNVKEGTIRKWMMTGKLPYIKIFRRSVIDPDVVQELIEAGRKGSVK